MASLHKHRMAARGSMLGSDVSTCSFLSAGERTTLALINTPGVGHMKSKTGAISFPTE